MRYDHTQTQTCLFTNLVVGQEVDQRVDQEAALGEQVEDPVEEAQSLVDPASVEVLVLALVLQVEVGVFYP